MSSLLRKYLLPVALVAAGGLMAFGLGRLTQSALPSLGPATVWAQETTYTGPSATVEMADAAGLQAGRIMVGDAEFAVLAVPAAGFTGYERAIIVADRINRQLQQGATPEAFELHTVGGSPVIQTPDGTNILTITPDDALHAGETTAELATRWTNALRQALGGSALGETPSTDPATTETPASVDEEWRPSEPYDDKYVPIISILQGTRLGIARVNGPRSRVQLVQATAQFSIDFGDFLEIDIYVPISTREPGSSLSRIQGVGITGLGDIRL